MGRKLFTVSYDDGTEQDFRIIELMERYGIKGTFNLSSGLFGRKSYIRFTGERGRSAAKKDESLPGKYVDHFILSKAEAVKLYSHPNVEVASHGTHHLVQSNLSREEAREEITHDVKTLSELFGYQVIGHAFPKDTFNDNVLDALKNSGVKYARRACHHKKPNGFTFDKNSFIIMPTCSQLDPFAEDLLREFISSPAGDDDEVFFMWGHGYELDYGTAQGSYERLERLFKMVDEAKDVCCVTNRELFK